MAKKKLTKEVYLKWYEDMLFWRKFEDMTSALYIQQKIRGFLHLYNGQEAVLAGSLLAMEQGDKMITAYRNHVQPIGLGVDPRKIMAELLGKVDGTSRGKGGSMHMFSKEHNFLWRTRNRRRSNSAWSWNGLCRQVLGQTPRNAVLHG